MFSTTTNDDLDSDTRVAPQESHRLVSKSISVVVKWNATHSNVSEMSLSKKYHHYSIAGIGKVFLFVVIVTAASTLSVRSDDSRQHLQIICDFLEFGSLIECQAATIVSERDCPVSTSSIPSEIGLLTQLSILDLQHPDGFVSLIGTIPSTLGSLTNLVYLDMNSNALTGNIPSALGSLTQLTYLNLQTNDLTGPIPSMLGSLVHMTLLNFNDMKLTGTVPDSLGQLSHLIGFSLGKNHLTGTIPTETFRNLLDLEFFILYDN